MLKHAQSLIFFLVTWGFIAFGVYRTVYQGYKPYIRKLAALEAIDEGIGLSVETGRKVHCGIPMSGLLERRAAEIMIGVAIMGYFARKAAAVGVDALYTVCEAPALPVVEGVTRDAYAAEGKLDDYENLDKVQVRMIGLHAAASYDMALAGMLQRDNIGTSVIAGPVGKYSLLQGEANREANVFSICCISENDKIEWLIPTFDYVLIILETYTAGALITQDEIQLGNVIGVDYMSWLMFALVVVFFIAAQAGFSLVGWS
jgi:hypothetical protein